MVKKIIGITIAIAIIATGIYGFKRLGYWQRSTAIFKTGSQSESFEGRGRNFRGQEGPEFRGERPQFGRGEIPDSIRRRFEQGFRRNQGADSLRQRPSRNGEGGFGPGQGRGGFGGQRGGFQGNGGGFGGRGHGEFEGGKKISLGSVAWFLAVFAGFAVIALYLDKLNSMAKKKRALKKLAIQP